MSIRRSAGRAPWRRYLVATALTTTVVLAAPGVASAAPDPAADLASELQEFGQQVQQLGGQQGSAPALEAGEVPTLPALPAFEVPDAVRDAFKQLTTALMIPGSCVDGIADAIELIINGLLDPTAVTDLLEQLTGLLTDFQGSLQDLIDLLTGGIPPLPDDTALAMQDLAAQAETIETGDDAEETGVAAGLTKLIETLTTKCIPTGSGGTTTPPTTTAPAGHTDTPVAPATTAEATPTTPNQPVSYLGYAPTGAGDDDASAAVPMAALGGLVLLAGAGGAVAYRRRASATGSQE